MDRRSGAERRQRPAPVPVDQQPLNSGDAGVCRGPKDDHELFPAHTSDGVSVSYLCSQELTQLL